MKKRESYIFIATNYFPILQMQQKNDYCLSNMWNRNDVWYSRNVNYIQTSYISYNTIKTYEL